MEKKDLFKIFLAIYIFAVSVALIFIMRDVFWNRSIAVSNISTLNVSALDKTSSGLSGRDYATLPEDVRVDLNRYQYGNTDPFR